MKRKVVATLVTVCMILTMLPMAVFAADKYQVTYDLDGGKMQTWATTGDTFMMASGDTVTLETNEPTKPGDNFSGWTASYVSGETTVALDVSGDTFNMPEGDVTIKALWNAVKAAAGEPVFDDENDSAAVSYEGADIEKLIAENVLTIDAVAAIEIEVAKVTVTVETGMKDAITARFEDGTIKAVEITTFKGKVSIDQDAWETMAKTADNVTLTLGVETDQETGDVLLTVEAKDAEGNDLYSGNNPGGTVTLKRIQAPEDAEDVAYLYYEEECVGEFNVDNGKVDVTLKHFSEYRLSATAPAEKPEMVDVTFKVVNGAWTSGDTASIVLNLEKGYVLTGNDVPTPGDPDEGFTVGAWTGDELVGGTPVGATVTGDSMTFTYTFEEATAPGGEEYNEVTFAVVNGTWANGTTTDIVAQVVSGETLTAEQIPTGMIANEGYEGGAWDVEPNTTDPVTKDVTYTYSFDKATEPGGEEYNEVTFAVVNGTWANGTTTDIVAQVVSGETLTAEQIPTGMIANEGYEGGAWDVEPNTTDPVTKDVTYTYSFDKATEPGEEDLYNVFYDAKGGSWDYVDENDYAEGDVVTIPSEKPVRSDYTFQGWTCDIAGHENELHAAGSTFTMPADDVTLTAQWEEESGSNSSSGGGGGGGTSTTYAVVVKTVDNGKVTTSHTSASKNTVVTLTVTPDSGYSLSELLVEAANDEEVTLNKESDTKYTFAMPGARVTVTATFVEGEAEVTPDDEEDTEDTAFPFVDVTENDWYYNAVKYAYDNGLMAGTATAVFSPNTTVTRGMIVAILYRLEGEPEVMASNPFVDVAADQYYADAVVWASANNIVSGYGDGTFGPNNAITREQMAAFLYRYAQYKGYDTTLGSVVGYADANQISDWAMSAMQWACGTELISGKGNGILDPLGTATRAEAAQILMQFCEGVVVAE